jgi:hypothetical protein
MLGGKHGGKIMAVIHDFVEDWIEMRSKLQRQVKLIESGEMGTGTNVIGSTTETTIIRLKKWIAELNDRQAHGLRKRCAAHATFTDI